MGIYCDGRFGTPIVYRTIVYINSPRVQTPNGIFTTAVNDRRFVDDCAFNATTMEADMQKSMDLFVTGCATFCLNINKEKRQSCIIRHPKLNITVLGSHSTAYN
ncbi:unnamed protein product [Schistocephalus solidus]|uniref:Glycoprotein 120 n=1 Tax=Schistocephalus solidus TaxID=70667 RepID=A0A183TAS9_SCHSO|nr:unnamed protein product [Schistocephalus solidus]